MHTQALRGAIASYAQKSGKDENNVVSEFMTYLSESSAASNYELTQLAKAYVKGDDQGPTAEDREKYPILSMLE